MMDEKKTIESESVVSNISRNEVLNICLSLAIIVIYLLSICLSVFFEILAQTTDKDAGFSDYSSEDSEKKKENPGKNKISPQKKPRTERSKMKKKSNSVLFRKN